MKRGEDPELDALLDEEGIEDDPDPDGDAFCIPEGETPAGPYTLRYGSIRAPRGHIGLRGARVGNFPVSKMPRKRGTALFWFRHTVPA